MNFDKQITDLQAWQEEDKENRCCLVLAADDQTEEVLSVVGGGLKNLATALAMMIDDRPELERLLKIALTIRELQVASGICATSRVEDKEITNEVKAAQEGESYAEEKKLNEYNNEQES